MRSNYTDVAMLAWAPALMYQAFAAFSLACAGDDERWRMQCVAVCCSVVQCVALCCSVLQCVAACCSALQYVAVSCSVIQCVGMCCNASVGTSTEYIRSLLFLNWPVLVTLKGSCNVLQCVAMCCSVLQFVAALIYQAFAEFSLACAGDD